MLQILTPPRYCLLLLFLLRALIRTLVLLEQRTQHTRLIAELYGVLTAGDSRESLEGAGETEGKEEVDEEDMRLMRFLLVCWRT